MTQSLEGKKVLVTGAGGGNGQAIAKLFTERGAQVAINGRSKERLTETADIVRSAGSDPVLAVADLTDERSVEEMCKQAGRDLGGLDIVVNNAGILVRAEVEEMSVADWDRTMATNIRAPFLVTKFTMPIMKQNPYGKRYIYISSISGKWATPVESAYNVSKAALINFAQCVAAEVGPLGITSNIVCPGWFETSMAKNAIADMAKSEGVAFDDDYYESVMTENMLKMKLTTNDIAKAVLNFASEDAQSLTAQTLNVDAGMCWW